jgi:hypothetical protein
MPAAQARPGLGPVPGRLCDGRQRAPGGGSHDGVSRRARRHRRWPRSWAAGWERLFAQCRRVVSRPAGRAMGRQSSGATASTSRRGTASFAGPRTGQVGWGRLIPPPSPDPGPWSPSASGSACPALRASPTRREVRTPRSPGSVHRRPDVGRPGADRRRESVGGMAGRCVISGRAAATRAAAGCGQWQTPALGPVSGASAGQLLGPLPVLQRRHQDGWVPLWPVSVGRRNWGGLPMNVLLMTLWAHRGGVLASPGCSTWNTLAALRRQVLGPSRCSTWNAGDSV